MEEQSWETKRKGTNRTGPAAAEQSWKPTDPNQKNPYQSGEHVYNPQDPTRKNPGQDSGTGDRQDREGSEDVEKRRAS